MPTIQTSKCHLAAIIALALMGCSSKPPEPAAPEANNAAVAALANEIDGLEKDIRMERLEARMTALEMKLGDVQTKQEVNDVLAEKAPKQPAVEPARPQPKADK
jgi:hypothetical protein